MLLTPDHPDAYRVIVLFNDRPCKLYLSANDEEGWVELPLISKMAPLNTNNSSQPSNEPLEKWEEIPTIIKKGKVKFIYLDKDKIA